MQSSGATGAQMNHAFQQMQDRMHANSAVANVEENVDSLLTKLEAAHGTKVKILTAEEEEAQLREKQSM